MKVAVFIAVVLAVACGPDKPVVSQASLEVPDFPGSSRGGFSSEYSSETMHKLSKAQQDLKSRSLDIQFRTLTLHRPTSIESVADHYSKEFSQKRLKRMPDKPIEQTKDSFVVWESEEGVYTSRVLATCVATKDLSNPCVVLLLAWGAANK